MPRAAIRLANVLSGAEALRTNSCEKMKEEGTEPDLSKFLVQPHNLM